MKSYNLKFAGAITINFSKAVILILEVNGWSVPEAAVNVKFLFGRLRPKAIYVMSVAKVQIRIY